MYIDKDTGKGRAGASPAGAGGGDRSTAQSGRAAAASPIEFRLDAASGVPTYLQLVHQVEHALRLGYLTLGDQLPKVRDVVASLAINPNTVLKAYHRDVERHRARRQKTQAHLRGIGKIIPVYQTL